MTTDIVLTGNVFGGQQDAAVATRGNCQRIVVTGNAIAGVGLRAGQWAMLELTNAPESTVQENVMDTKSPNTNLIRLISRILVYFKAAITFASHCGSAIASSPRRRKTILRETIGNCDRSEIPRA
ncbi:hypothetical protein [Planctellipticum variicoloris]|uniref:hypothetical protein n=1 Tax=Planctellipticum variicoloris TaxID=3064265 RepID=UPI003013FECD|nr:hypothetical protein SH412_003091 [Planctomycetaceae bacterium SH412]